MLFRSVHQLHRMFQVHPEHIEQDAEESFGVDPAVEIALVHSHERGADLKQGVPEGKSPVVPLQSGREGRPGVGLERQPVKVGQDFVEFRGILLLGGAVPEYGAYLLCRFGLPSADGVRGVRPACPQAGETS